MFFFFSRCLSDGSLGCVIGVRQPRFTTSFTFISSPLFNFLCFISVVYPAALPLWLGLVFHLVSFSKIICLSHSRQTHSRHTPTVDTYSQVQRKIKQYERTQAIAKTMTNRSSSLNSLQQLTDTEAIYKFANNRLLHTQSIYFRKQPSQANYTPQTNTTHQAPYSSTPHTQVIKEMK